MEDNNDHLSTEEILSSIRGQLLADGQDDVFRLLPSMIVKPSKKASVNKKGSIASDKTPSSSDVLNLRPSMIIGMAEAVEKDSEEAPLQVSPSHILDDSNIEKAVASKVSKKASFKAQYSADEDVARGIIDAFSHMFSNIKSWKISKSAQGNVTHVDNYNVDVLKNSISKTVEHWVLGNVDSDVELQDIVRQEVAGQVRVWLDANLERMITSSIRQELERVMVKTGGIR